MLPLHRTRRLFAAAILALLAADLLVGAFLLSPWGRSRQRLEEEYSRLRLEWQRKQVEVAPLAGMDAKLLLAQKEIADFSDTRLPARSSDVSVELGKLADKDSVKISEVRYETKDADIAGLRRVAINAGLTGDYLQIVKFINHLERDRLFFILDDISLAEQQGGNVRLQLRFETYVKGS